MVIDCSENMKETDLSPSRLVCVFRAVLKFAYEFFERNPLSMMHFIASASGLAIPISSPSGKFNFLPTNKTYDYEDHYVYQ